MKKIISGGQTGVDRIGLEVARELGFATGGTAPKGFRTENGPDPSLRDFGLVEHESTNYEPRTIQNILDADGTVILGNVESAGSWFTRRQCVRLKKPYSVNPTVDQLVQFVHDHAIITLNVAGNRASGMTSAGMEYVRNILQLALQRLR